MTPVAAQVSITAIIPMLIDRDRKSAMGTVQRTGGRFCIPVWSRGMARGF